MVYRPGYVWTGSAWDEIGDPRVGSPEQNPITTTDYTAVLLDVGKTVTRSNAAASTHTIPAQASVSWADNTQLNFLNIGAGTVTITPAVDVTINGEPLTLETSKGGSLVRTASNTWTFTPSGGGGGGKILQLLAINSDSTVTNSTLTAATLLTLSITPSSTDSKVLVMGSLSVLNTAGSNGLCDLNIERGVTIWLIGRGGNSASVNNRASLAGNIIDAPASTSSLTYELTFAKTSSGTTSVTTQGYYTLTLMEVAA